jgi:transposase
LFLLPPSVKDWLPSDHLAYFIIALIPQFDLKPIYAKFKNQFGAPAFRPEVMVAIWLYAYCVGIRSSRRVMKELVEDVAFRVVAGNQQPDFRTLNEFRRKHHKILAGLFIKTVQMAQKAGLVKMGHIAIDGTKIKANASKHSAMSYGRMKEEEERLRKEIERWFEEADAIDAAEDELYGDKAGWELPEHLSTQEKRLEAIQKAMKELEEEAKQAAAEEERKKQEEKAKRRTHEEKRKQRREEKKQKKGKNNPASPEPDPKAQRNFTDSESRIMLNSEKTFIQGYNAHAAVDAETQIIVAADLTNQAGDSPHLPPLVKQATENTGQTPAEASADAAYCSEDNLKFLEDSGIEAFIPPNKVKHNEWREAKPMRGRPPKNLSRRQTMKRKLLTKRGKERYKLRMTSVEPVFGQIKEARGLRQFLHRGLEKVHSMWLFECAAHNIMKMFRAGVVLNPV